MWAQVAPGNAASLRAFLAAGFVPVGSEVTAGFTVLHDDGGQIDGGTLATVAIR